MAVDTDFLLHEQQFTKRNRTPAFPDLVTRTHPVRTFEFPKHGRVKCNSATSLGECYLAIRGSEGKKKDMSVNGRRVMRKLEHTIRQARLGARHPELNSSLVLRKGVSRRGRKNYATAQFPPNSSTGRKLIPNTNSRSARAARYFPDISCSPKFHISVIKLRTVRKWKNSLRRSLSRVPEILERVRRAHDT